MLSPTYSLLHNGSGFHHIYEFSFSPIISHSIVSLYVMDDNFVILKFSLMPDWIFENYRATYKIDDRKQWHECMLKPP